MAEHEHEYHRGDQDITEQERMFHAFGAMTKWGSLITAVAVLMLAIWFCTPMGFFGGLIPGVVVLAAGIFFLRSPPAGEHH
jgi:uncharacterized membrane protein